METYYLSLGSNLGNRAANLRFGLERLSESGEVVRVSAFYETAPVGYADQPDFLNAAAEFRSVVEPIDLLGRIKDIECGAGRNFDEIRWGPRTLDIDILLCGSRTVSSGRLTIPHPRMHEREFVLAPLVEIAPDVVVPVIEKTVRTIWSGQFGDNRRVA